MNFSDALNILKDDGKICRSGWNGEGMFLFLVKSSKFKATRKPLSDIFGENDQLEYCSHIGMKTADNKLVPWIASQTDLLSEDWETV